MLFILFVAFCCGHLVETLEFGELQVGARSHEVGQKQKARTATVNGNTEYLERR